jgi:hypothetical protein
MLTVVWSDKAVPELDDLISKATVRGKTAVLDTEALIKPLTFFLEKNRVPIQVTKNDTAHKTELRSTGDLAVHQIRLEHQ